MLRQVKITVPDTNQATGEAYTDKELELMAAECLETGTSPYLAALAASTLEDVLRKHEAIKKLERDVELVAEMFQDLATLVSAQGEQLDHIEDHVRTIRFRCLSHFGVCAARCVLDCCGVCVCICAYVHTFADSIGDESVCRRQKRCDRVEEGERAREEKPQANVLPVVVPSGCTCRDLVPFVSLFDLRSLSELELPNIFATGSQYHYSNVTATYTLEGCLTKLLAPPLDPCDSCKARGTADCPH